MWEVQANVASAQKRHTAAWHHSISNTSATMQAQLPDRPCRAPRPHLSTLSLYHPAMTATVLLLSDTAVVDVTYFRHLLLTLMPMLTVLML